MSDKNILGPWIRRFLLEHLVGERNLARNTQVSYRDTLALLIPFTATKVGKPVDRMTIEQITPEVVSTFLAHLEQVRGCGISMRNQRLAAIHALARFIATHSPEHIAWCTSIRTVPFKRGSKDTIPYLDKPEMDALIDAAHRAFAITPSSYSSTTGAQGPMKRHALQLLISNWELHLQSQYRAKAASHGSVPSGR